MGKEYTEAQKQATLKYLAEKTDLVQIRVRKGVKNEWKSAADLLDVSLNQMVIDAVNQYIK